MYKILIGNKNSKWKVVQNQIKGNYYTDIIDFRDESEKEAFLDLNFFPDWKNIENGSWIETPIIWKDEIHGSFTIDLKKTDFERKDGIRKDFAVVFDGKNYSFYTLEASLKNKQVFSTLSFNIELDIFFTYGIKNIWKPNSQIEINRGVVKPEQTSYLIIPEDFSAGGILTSKNSIFADDLTGYLLFFKTKTTYISETLHNNSSNSNVSFKGSVINTISLTARKNNQGIDTNILYLEGSIGNAHYSNTFGDYQYLNNAENFSEKPLILFVSKDDYNNNKLLTPSCPTRLLFSSPELLNIVPINYIPKLNKIDGAVFWNGSTVRNSEIEIVNFSSSSTIYFNSNYRGNFNIVVDTPFIQKTLLTLPSQSEKYLKINTFPYNFINLKSSTGLSMNINFLFTQDLNIEIERKRSIAFDGMYSKISVNNGFYLNGSIRNEFSFETNDNITFYQATDRFLEFANNNIQSINNTARQNRKDSIFSKISGSIGIGTSLLSAAAGAATGGIGAVLGLGALGSLTSNIQQIANSNNQINSLSYSINDAISSGSNLVNTGNEFSRLSNLDNPFSIEVDYYQLPDQLLNLVITHFKKYGYKLGINANPLDWLENGIYWDYIEAPFGSVYQALNETLSPQESKIAAESISSGIRIWHWKPDVPENWEIGNYSLENL